MIEIQPFFSEATLASESVVSALILFLGAKKFKSYRVVSSDGRVVRASASRAVDLGLIPIQVKKDDFEISIPSFPA